MSHAVALVQTLAKYVEIRKYEWKILKHFSLSSLAVSYNSFLLESLIMTDVLSAEFTNIIVSTGERERIFIARGGEREKT